MSDIESWVERIGSTLDQPWVGAWFSRRIRPKRLYHYGRAEALLSILEGQRLWATDARYLNDASELRYTNNLVRETVGAMTAKAASAVMRRFLEGLLSSNQDSGGPAVYTVSLSEDGDILSQWRAYAGAAGYAIGLSTEWWDMPDASGETSERRPGPLRLRQVIYAEDEQRRMIRSLLDPACTTLAEVIEWFGEETTLAAYEPQLRWHVTDYLRLLLPCLKHPAFAEEREWRFIYMPNAVPSQAGTTAPDVQFRHSAIGLVPYVTLALPATDGPYRGRLPVTEIYYGPSEFPDLAARALSMLLEKHGYVEPPTQVKGSRAPLRM
jgi:hypothetical protein